MKGYYKQPFIFHASIYLHHHKVRRSEKIKKLTDEQIIICPECKSPLILRAGHIKVPHFAHKHGCSYVYREPETEQHIRGKLELQQQLNILYPKSTVHIEYKIHETNQRSDVIVIHPNGLKWAFEVQCTRIPISTIIERSLLYKQAGVEDFWFLGYEYSSYFSYSGINKLGIELDRIKKKLFRLFFEKSILVGHNHSNEMNLSDMMLKRTGDHFIIKNRSAYQKSKDLYSAAKEAFYAYLNNKYSNSIVQKDYLLENSREKADIIIISNKTGEICVFNFLYPFVNSKSLIIRNIEYKKRKIRVFWLYGKVTVDAHTYSVEEILPDQEEMIYLNYEKGQWLIHVSINYKNSPVYDIFELSMLKISNGFNRSVYILENKNHKSKIISYKEINWSKFINGTWNGYVYKCQISGLEDHDLKISNIRDCEKCKLFGGYLYKFGKQYYVKCIKKITL